MNHVVVTIYTNDNNLRSFSFAPEFFKDQAALYEAVVAKLVKAKEDFGDKIIMTSVAEKEPGEAFDGFFLEDIDEAIAIYQPKKAKK
jgi:hypothetical protein